MFLVCKETSKNKTNNPGQPVLMSLLICVTYCTWKGTGYGTYPNVTKIFRLTVNGWCQIPKLTLLRVNALSFPKVNALSFLKSWSSHSIVLSFIKCQCFQQLTANNYEVNDTIKLVFLGIYFCSLPMAIDSAEQVESAVSIKYIFKQVIWLFQHQCAIQYRVFFNIQKIKLILSHFQIFFFDFKTYCAIDIPE